MTKKVSITKSEEDIAEVGIQVRTDNQTLVENIETDGNDLKALLKGSKRKMNVGVYATDPVDLTLDQAWINDTDLKLRWSVGGVVREINLPKSEDLASLNTSEDLYNLLFRLEDKKLIQLPVANSIYDTFDTEKGIKQDCHLTNDGIVVNEGETSGSYTKEELQSKPANNVEGTLTFNAQSFKAASVLNNTNGTHNVVLSGVLTDYFSVGKELFPLEVTKTLINEYKESNNQLDGLKRNIPDRRSLPMLDDDLNPVIVDVASLSNDGTNTTLVLNTGTHNLESLNELHLLVKPASVKAGVNGSSGTLDDLQIKELRSIDKNPNTTLEGVQCHDTITKLMHNSRFEACNKIVWKHSPNKKNWIILGRFGTQAAGDRWYIWYSNDGMNSIQHHNNFSMIASLTPANEPVTHTTKTFDASSYQALSTSEDLIHIHDDGRFVFSKCYWDTVYSRWNADNYFGKVSGEFIIREPSVGAAGTGKNQIALENSSTFNYFLHGSAMDWDSGTLAVSISRGSNDAYLDFWSLDFDQYLSSRSGFMGYSDFAAVIDYGRHYHAAIIFWSEFEGERSLFCGMLHVNGHTYATKISRQGLLKEWRDNHNSEFKYQNLNVAGASPNNAFCASSDYEDGTRYNNTPWMHEIAATTVIESWHLSPDKTLICFGSDYSHGFTFLSLTDFGRTMAGILPEVDLTFDGVPDLGVHSVNKVVFDAEPTSGLLTIQIAGTSFGTVTRDFYDPENPNLNNAKGIAKDFVDGISWLEDGELEVTGDAATGFTFNWKHLPEAITITTTTNTLLASSTAVVETHTVETTGVDSQGGELDIEVSQWRKDATNTKAQVSTSNAIIKAGMSNEAIANIINATTTIGGNVDKGIQEKYKESETLSRVNKKILHMMPFNTAHNTRGRKVPYSAPEEFFNVELEVNNISYDLKLEIMDNDGSTILWSSENTYTDGNHTIPVDFTKFSQGSYLVATSHTDHESDYVKAKFYYDYALNYWVQEKEGGGVSVEGSWSTGLKIVGHTNSDIRFSTSTNTLVDGSSATVNPTFTEVTQGHGGVFLKYDNDAHGRLTGDNSLFWNNTTNGRNHDGQSYRLRDSTRLSKYVMGVLRSDVAQWRMPHTHLVDDYSILMATDTVRIEYSSDKNVAEIIKIPDYREMHGLMWDNSTNTEVVIMPKINPATNGATKFAHKFSVPNLGYSSNTFPLRTLEIGLRKSWSTNVAPFYGPQHFDAPDAYVKVSIVGLSGGFPDESNVIAESISKVPLIDIPQWADGSTDGRKFLPFIFDNVQLTPSSDVCIIVEIDGLDVENLPTNSFTVNLSANTNASGTAFSNSENVWTPINYDLSLRFYDYYSMIPHHCHENGFNKYVNMFSRVGSGHLSGSVVESTLGKIEGNKFLGTYNATSAHIDLNNTARSVFAGGNKAYSFIVDNESIASKDHPPVIKEPEILGVENQEEVDKSLVWGHAFGYTPDGAKSLYLSVDAKPEGYTDYNNSYLTEENDNYRYNGSSHFGGHQISYDNDTLNRLRKYTESQSGNVGGVVEDTDFLYGRAVRFAHSGGLYTYYPISAFMPFQKDFVWECELKADNKDTHHTSTHVRVLFGTNNGYYMGLKCEDSSGNNCRYMLTIYNEYGANLDLISVETVPTEVYHRYRVSRDYTNGVRMYRNFTKDDDNAWEELTVDEAGSSDTVNRYRHSLQIGHSSLSRDYMAIGRWTENALHNFNGAIGYMKLAIGNHEFKYNGLNFTQPEIAGVRNKGSHIIAYNKVEAGRANNHDRTKAEMVVARHSTEIDSRVNTNEYAASFDQTLSEGGRNKTVKIELEREDSKDPSKVNGYLIEFNRK